MALDFDYYSTNGAAKELGVSKQSIHNMIKAGKISFKLTSSGKYLLEPDEVQVLKIAREVNL